MIRFYFSINCLMDVLKCYFINIREQWAFIYKTDSNAVKNTLD